jgi:hypothetical protein
LSDDEDSVILVPEPDMFCGACSRHDSGIWWRAPKGLQSDVLCDTCGDNWRKYADLNISRPQEEILPLNKTPKVDKEKREGTPLVGPISKKVKVVILSSHILRRIIEYVSTSSDKFRDIVTFPIRVNNTTSLHGVSQERFDKRSPEMPAMPVTYSCQYVASYVLFPLK